jgi:hypothetical protein
MTVVSRFVLCVVQSALLSACAMGVYEVPIGSVDAMPSDVERLQIGESRRDDVLAALGGDPLVLFSSDGFEIYQLSTGRSSVGIALLFPLIPVPFPARELQEGQLRMLAVYDDAGVVRRLDWEHARFSKSPLRDERREPLSEPLVTGFEEAGGPLVVDAHGAAGTAVSVDPAALPAPRLVWEADTLTAATQGAFAILGEVATGRLTVRELASGAVIASTRPPADSCGPPPHTGWLQADGRHVLFASSEGDLCLWDTSSSEQAAPLTASDAETKPHARRVAVAGGAPVAATYDAVTRTISIWNTQAGDLRSALPVGQVAALAVSSDGERLAIVDQKMEQMVLSTTSGEELARVKLSELRVRPLQAIRAAMAPDGRIIAINRTTHVELWRLVEASARTPAALRLEAVLLLPVASSAGCPVPLAFSANGGRLAAGCDSAVVWETNTWRELLRLVPDAEGKIGGEQAWIDEGFALSADGRTILTTHGVWDVPDLAPAPSG